jgi:hypothetical protein
VDLCYASSNSSASHFQQISSSIPNTSSVRAATPPESHEEDGCDGLSIVDVAQTETFSEFSEDDEFVVL